MSIFGSIWTAIVGHGSGASTASMDSMPSLGKPAAPSTGAPAPSSAPAASTPASAMPSAAAGAQVDVTGILDGLAGKAGQKLNWRVSIVDLMKLLNLDSSLGARKQLAEELHYTGDIHDSAAMNIWLHKQVMTKLAENGGNVPADLKH